MSLLKRKTPDSSYESLLVGATHAVRQVLIMHQSKLPSINPQKFAQDMKSVVLGELAQRVREGEDEEQEDGDGGHEHEVKDEEFHEVAHPLTKRERAAKAAAAEPWRARPRSYTRIGEIGLPVFNEVARASAGLVPKLDPADRRFIFVDVPPVTVKPFVAILKRILKDDAYIKDRREPALRVILQGLKKLEGGATPTVRVKGINRKLAKSRRQCVYCGWSIQPETGDLDFPFVADPVMCAEPENQAQHYFHAACLAVLRASGFTECFCQAYCPEPRTCVKRNKDAVKKKKEKIAAQALLQQQQAKKKPSEEEDQEEEEEDEEE